MSNCVDIVADLERVSNALAAELRSERRGIHGKVPVGLMVLDDDDTGEDAARIHADENSDRTVVASLERFKLRRPEPKAEKRFSRRARGFSVHAEMRRHPFPG